MNDPRLVESQRLRWVPDQLLRGADLRDQLAFGDQLRWWHNRAAHHAVGVASGLEVTLTDDGQSVTVQPGVAHDRVGRPLWLLAPRRVPLPGDQQPATLVARWRAPGAEPELVWLAPREFDTRAGVPLARVAFPTSFPELQPLGSGSRPLARPRIGYGATPPDGTAWEQWFLLRELAGIQVTVDTRPAGFTDVPCYFAWLQWPQVGSSQLPYMFYVELALQYVEEPAIDRFVFRVALRPSSRDLQVAKGPAAPRVRIGRGGQDMVSTARGQRLSVCWLGVQAEDEGTSDGRHG